MAKQLKRIDDETRSKFRTKFQINSSTGCWEWQEHLLHGYGNFRGIVASRASWILFVGTIPEGLYVLHKCDNPSCVNPKHLFTGTQKENIQDCIRKGRFNAEGKGSPGDRNGARLHPERLKRGEDNFKAKLTAKQVAYIRQTYKRLSNNVSNAADLAAKFGVTKKTILNVATKRFWKHVATK